jgi:hypothetical protein
MSNFLALATVTASLQRLLQAAVQEDVDGASVTTVRPDGSSEGLPEVGANLYLYQVTPNASWRNHDLPTRSRGGSLVQRPTMALDLHYLLTFYGDDSTYQSQRVMGSALRALLTHPVLTRAMVEETVAAARASDPDHPLAASDLAASVESVKLSPVPLTLEELSRLWSVFFQTPYTLSMAYTGTVVLLESEETPGRPLPVRERRIGVFPFQRAVLEAAVSPLGDLEPVEMGGELLLRGTGLGGPVARVRVGPADLVPVEGSVTGTSLRVLLTPPTLRAGIQAVQVVYHNGATSTVVPVVLRPVIGVGAGVTSSALPVSLDPPVGRRQTVRLFLNELGAPADREPRAHVFDAPPDNGIPEGAPDAVGVITFPISGVEPGSYLVRVEVAGAESVPGVDLVEGSPTFGRYTTPSVTIP